MSWMELQGLDDADLAALRAGQLGPRRGARLAAGNARSMRVARLLALIALGLGVVGVVAGAITGASGLIVAGVLIAICLGGIAGAAFAYLRQIPAEVRAGRVDRAEGAYRMVAIHDRTPATSFQLHVGKVSFAADDGADKACRELGAVPVRVYFLPKTRVLVAIEPLEP